MKPNKELLDFQGFIFDMDGVIYRGNKPIPGAIETIDALREEGKKLVFVSNNSTKAREDYQDKISSLGLPISVDEIIPTTYATAQYLAKNAKDAKIHVIGSAGLIKELVKADLHLCDDYHVDHLVTGSDTAINFQKFTNGVRALLGNAKWIATNVDKLYPAENGITPGTGVVIGALSYTTGRNPDVVIGKPSTEIMHVALSKIGTRNCIIIGDILESDIKAGKNVGIKTALVLSGVTRSEDLGESDIAPDYVLSSIKEVKGN